MKKLLLFTILLAFVLNVAAAERKILVEKFYDTKTAGCHRFEEDFNDYLSSYEDHVVQVQYHVDRDTIDIDPFFAAAEAAQYSRAAYYNFKRCPLFLTNSYEQYTAEDANSFITSELDVTSEVSIRVAFEENSIEVVIDVEESVGFENAVLNVIITESNIDYDATSGATVFNNVFRKAIPDINGSIIDISTVGEQTINLAMDYPYEYENYENLELVVFIQDRFSKKIVNANSFDLPEAPEYAVATVTNHQRSVKKSGAWELVGYLHFKNVGTTSDRYHVSMEADCPDDWTMSYCTSTACWPFTSPFDTLLNPGEEEEVSLHIYPTGNAGAGTVTVNIQSTTTGEVVPVVFEFVAVSDGSYDVLCVLDEGYSFNRNLYYDLLEGMDDFNYCWIDRSETDIDAEFLSYFRAVMWSTGYQSFGKPVAEDLSLLGEYLDANGNLLISGSELGNSIGETDFFRTYLRNSYSASDDNASSYSITGDETHLPTLESNLDPYTTNDILHPADDSEVIVYYGDPADGEIAGFKYSSSFNLIYLGFTLPYVKDTDDRELLFSTLVDDLFYAVDEKEVNQPEKLSLIENYPNPFNPFTEIRYTIREASDYELSIYDLSGKKIKDIDNRYFNEGEYTYGWNGKDNNDYQVPTGIYFVNLRSETENVSKSILLMK